MKGKIIVFLLSIFVVSFANAQTLDVGLKAGVNINKLSGKSFNDQFSYGYHAGAFVGINLGKKWAFQPEVLFSQTNVDTSTEFRKIYDTSINALSGIKLSYLSIPLLLEYKLSKGIAIQAGPQYSILLNQNSDLLKSGKKAFKSGDFSLLAGIEIKFSGIHVYGRYAIGLSNLNDIDNQDEWKSQTVQLGLGVTLF